VLFHEAIEEFNYDALEESFARFERAAVKGHEESIWILCVVKDMEDRKGLKEAFVKMEEPLGWYFAGMFSYEREAFDFYKKSAEAGCSWGQFKYGTYFDGGWFVEADQKAYVEWLGKAAKQNNPKAMDWLGNWFRYDGGDEENAVSYYRTAAELGWKESIYSFADMLKWGEGCGKDLRQAVMWSAKGSNSDAFWAVLGDARRVLESGATEDMDCDFNHLCFALGTGLFWDVYGSEKWNKQSDEMKDFGERCLDYYCSCVDLQQESIFTFLWCWNRTTGVKGPGQMIAEMVWEGRKDYLVKTFEENDGGDAPRLKRIKK
jgi:hypothetical protein